MEITRYKREHEAAVLAAIKEDPDWDMFTNDGAIDTYRKRLRESITYVCYEGEIFSGYLRALLDDEFALYISELFVVPEMRNRKIGRALISKLKGDYSDLTVYALSDEDLYYEKLGYKKVGSVFEINQ
ncbi:MAG: GNAT family N-acetyltransferase [Sedimenticola sp.]